MPRVLVISHSSINASHRDAYDLLASRPGWDVHIAAPRFLEFAKGQRKVCDPPARDARYTLHLLGVRGLKLGRFISFGGLARLIWRLRPNVIFAEYDPGSLPVLRAAALGRWRKIPVVAFSVENILHHRGTAALQSLLAAKPKPALRDATIATLDAAGAAATSSLICISPQGEEVFKRRGWRKRTAVMPLGTNTERFRKLDVSSLRNELSLSEAFVVGYFGRLVPEKGVHHLIAAMAKLPEEVHLLLDMFTNFAPGSYADELMCLVDELGVKQRVTTVDVAHDAIPRYMNCCDVVVLPSQSTPRWREQFGRVLPEAMACEVPVIGTRSGNIPDLVGDAGLLVPEGDPAVIANAILRVKTEPGLKETLAHKGRARVVEGYSLERQVDVLERVLRASIAG